jgi:hypothetical protein
VDAGRLTPASTPELKPPNFRSWRIYNLVDVVPYFPFDTSDSYQPVTAGYAINSLGKARWSLGCAHALNTYLHVLSPAVALNQGCQPG